MATFARGIPTTIILPLISCFSFIHCQDSTNRQEKVLHRAITKFKCESEGFYPDPNDCSVFYRCLDWAESSENSMQSRFTLFKFRCTIGTVFDLETNSCIHAREATRLECRHDFSEPLLIDFPKANAFQADGSSNNQVDYGVFRPQKSNRPPQRSAYTKSSIDVQLEPMNEVDNTIAVQPLRLTRSPLCNADGYFPIDNDCTHFYRCVSSGQGFNKYDFSCGEGTVWDPDNNACNHPWAVQRQDCQNVGRDTGAGSADIDTMNITGNAERDSNQGNSDVFPDQLLNLSQKSGQSSSGYPNPGNEVNGYLNQGYPNGGNEYPSQSNPNAGSGSYPIQGNPNGGSGYSNQPVNQNPESEENFSSSPTPKGEASESSPSNNASGSSQPVGKPGGQNGSSGTKNSTCAEEGFHPEPSDCKKFYRCVNFNGIYTKFDFECAEGTVWDISLLTCNYPYAVEQSGCQPIQSNQSPTSGESYNSNGSGTSSNQQTITSDVISSPGLNQQGSPPSGTSSNQQTTTSDVISSAGLNQQGSPPTSSNQSFISNQQSSSTLSQQTSSTSHPQTLFNSSQSSLSTSFTSSQTTSSSVQQASIASGQNNSTSNQQTSTTSSGNQMSSGNPNSNKNDQCTEEGFFPSSTNCNKFFRCVKYEGYGYTKYEFNCGPGTVFDPAYNVCNHPSAVTNKKCNNGGEDGTSMDGSMTPAGDSESSTISSPSSSATKPSNKNTPTTKLGSNTPTTTKPGTNDPNIAKPIRKPNKNTTTIAKPVTSKPLQNKPGSTPPTSNNYSTTLFPHSSDSTTKIPSNPSSKPPNSTSQPAGSSKPSNESTLPVESTKPNNQTSINSTTPINFGTAANTIETTCQNSTKPAIKISCTNAGFYAHPDNCKKFYRCVDIDGNKGKRFSVFHFDCPEGTIFDPSLDTCNHEASVYPPRDCSGSGNATTETTSLEETSTPGDNTNAPIDETITTSSTTEASTEQPTGETSTHTGETSTHTGETSTHTGETSTHTGETSTHIGETSITGGVDMTTVSGSETTVGSTNPQTSMPTELSKDSTNPVMSTTVPINSNTEESTTDSNQLITTVSYTTTNNPSTNNPIAENPTTTISLTTDEISTSTNEKCPELGPDQFNLVCPTGFRRHPKYCNLFYQCTTSPSNGIKVLTLSCPNGTHYDQSKIQCLPPDQAQKCEGSSINTRTLRQMADSVIPIPVKAEKSICPNEGSFTYKDDCRLFFKCNKDNERKLNGFLYQCPEGFAYWSISKRCEKIAKVPCDSGKKATGKPTLAPIEPKDVGSK